MTVFLFKQFYRARNWLTLPRGIVHRIIAEFLLFGAKQAWACLFGGLLLILIISSALYYPENAKLARYDFLLIGAISIQIALLTLKLETFSEIKVIVLFHLVGTLMEIFKVHMGSWSYPEASLIRIGDAPLFSGFMYSAVGSYIARVWRSFDFRFIYHPPVWAISLLSIAVYINFFSHHFIIDIRIPLFIITGLLFLRTQIYFKILDQHRSMPLLVGFLLVASFIWMAENISTFANVWLYPAQQNGWQIISFSKIGYWFLLMIISYGLISRLHKISPPPHHRKRTVYK